MTTPHRTPEEALTSAALAVVQAAYRTVARGVCAVPDFQIEKLRDALAQFDTEDAALPRWTPEAPTAAGWTGLLLEPGDRPQWVEIMDEENESDPELFWVLFADGDVIDIRCVAQGSLWLGPIAMPEGRS